MVAYLRVWGISAMFPYGAHPVWLVPGFRVWLVRSQEVSNLDLYPSHGLRCVFELNRSLELRQGASMLARLEILREQFLPPS